MSVRNAPAAQEIISVSIDARNGKTRYGKKKISIFFGDICSVRADALVCPVDHRVSMDWDIDPPRELSFIERVVRKAGFEVFDEARKVGAKYNTEYATQELLNSGLELPLGATCRTNAGSLTAVGSIIHVNEVSKEGFAATDVSEVAVCVAAALREAHHGRLCSVSLPQLGARAGTGFSIDETLKAVSRGLNMHFNSGKHSNVQHVNVVIDTQSTESNVEAIANALYHSFRSERISTAMKPQRQPEFGFVKPIDKQHWFQR